jgi:Reverse transcriptase (RNA-dependent DNA polymerase)
LRANPCPNSKYTTQDPGTDTDPPLQRQQQKQKKKRSSGQLSHLALLAAAEYQDPLTFKQAMASDYSDDWRATCQYEIDALAKNSTWTLVDLPTGRKAIKSKWVFKCKADGHFRAHLVAKGFTQVHGIDYDETFSPVARFESLRLLLVLTMLEDWEIHQMDVKSAFLNGLLDEEIYMEQPTGFVVPGQSKRSVFFRRQSMASNKHRALGISNFTQYF